MSKNVVVCEAKEEESLPDFGVKSCIVYICNRFSTYIPHKHTIVKQNMHCLNDDTKN